MKTFKQIIAKLIPANNDYQFLEVKELADAMIAARAGAQHHVMLYLKAAKDHETAYNAYLKQLGTSKTKGAY